MNYVLNNDQLSQTNLVYIGKNILHKVKNTLHYDK